MATTARGVSSKLSQQPLSSPLPGNSQPKRKKRVPVICPICEETVEDASSKKRGHDAIFCEGACQDWLHRQCAGLSKVNFDAAKASNLPFLCPCCRLSDKSTELSALKATVDELVAEVSKLKSFCSSVTGDNLASLTHSHSETKAASSSANSVELLHPIKGHPTSQQPQSHHGSKSLSSVSDRKFNIVIFGVSELSDCSSRFLRHDHDFQGVSLILSNLELGPNRSSSIRDCHRLGKYVSSSVRPRPLLVQLNSTADVSKVLSKRHSVPSSISIKPDLSLADRKIEALLLKERWQLIQSGIDRRFIKVRGSKIFVKNQLHGKVVDSTLSLVSGSEVLPINSTVAQPSTAINPFSPSTATPVTHCPAASGATNKEPFLAKGQKPQHPS